ncbi:hypothetical protein PRZ48_014455 [Zasmidium cellare]|uniref:DUF7907 domain-containing protein n=1 Tax=Zasmidium cellare TaxID=395010 RepID=A0ABR0DYB4_ZASCE|nr:hypothetical protein PRZ48_014455 [Zasmidium cellare]
MVSKLTFSQQLLQRAKRSSHSVTGKDEYEPGDLGKGSFCTGPAALLMLTDLIRFCDVTLTSNFSSGIKGFLNATNITTPSAYGGGVYNQVFDLGNPFPWGLVMVPYETFYTQWQPVEINAGAVGSSYTVSGFFINETGLQWTSNPNSIGGGSDSFGGWFVCDWWHGTFQLFFRLYSSSGKSTPSSCADVYLVPEYI